MNRSFWALLGFLLLVGWSGAAWDKAIPPQRAIPTLEAALQELVEHVQQAPRELAPRAAALGMSLSDGRVVVVVEADALDRAAVASLEGEVTQAALQFGVWEVHIPAERLPELAAVPGVRYVRRPGRPVPLAVSQGVALTGAPAWHAAGLGGAGVRVAVIDPEFGGLARALAAGELRGVVVARDYTGTGLDSGGPHGVACAEIVHDMAPMAELILMKVDNEVQLAQAVADAVDLGARVITHSAGWFNTNFYDGTGVVCDIVRSVTNRGVLWVNAVGNSAAGAHWGGAWVDRDGDGFLDFAPGVNVNSFTIEAGVPFAIWLTWDGWPTTDQDYDLYLVELHSGLIVESSTTTQIGGQPPTELVFYVPPFPGTYGVAVRAHSAPQAPRLKLFTSTRVKLQYSTAASSIPAPGNAPFVLTVGAIASSSWTTGPQEPFSSQGPTNRSRLNPASLVKPDLMGPDRVDTLSYGPGAFTGTSASSPHVAGAAALVWSANSSWTASQVRDWLERNAVDMGTPGKDNVYGHGRLHLPAPATPPPSGVSHTYGEAAGWYLVSVPTSGDSAQVFGTTLYRWTGTAYETAATLDPTMGYWARLPAAKNVTATGTVSITDHALPLDRVGWHMISAPWATDKSAIEVTRAGETRSWADAVTIGWLRDTVWGYRATDGAYTRPAVIEPWYGYWLYARVAGLILQFRARSSPPPPPPTAASAAHDESPPPPPSEGTPSPSLQVVNAPNPIRDVHTTTFRVQGLAAGLVTEMRVEVYDLAGKPVWEGSALGPELDWHTDDLSGRHLANGVYLYRVTAVVAGQRVGSEVKTLAIYR